MAQTPAGLPERANLSFPFPVAYLLDLMKFKVCGAVIKVRSKLIYKFMIGLIILFALLVIGERIFFLYKIPPGLFIGEHCIGLMTYGEVEKFLEDLKFTLEEGEVYLYLQDRRIAGAFSLAEIGISFDKERTRQEVMNYKTPYLYFIRYKFKPENILLPAHFKIKEDEYAHFLKSIEAKASISPQNARVWAENCMLKLSPHRRGLRINTENLSHELFNHIIPWPSFPVEIKLQVEYVMPVHTVSYIMKEMGIKSEIVRATTFFNPLNQNRVHNISLAASKVDNFLLAPGEIFSFNQIVGEATYAAGYKDAPIIYNQQYIMGAGGGICQVSSTIYNAALKAGLVIEERHNHGLPVTYLPPGLDAAVAYPHMDLKFKNNLPCHILIHLQVMNNELKVSFFGNDEALPSVNVITRNIEIIPPPIHYKKLENKPINYKEIIQEGRSGFIVETTRVFYGNEKEIYREQLGKDYYAPIPEIIGTGVLKENINKYR